MSYDYNFIVNKTEADALKEMIFKRVRDRAEVLDDNIKNSYTSDIKKDIMDLAHNSLVKTNNPFTNKLEEIKDTTGQQKTNEVVEEPQKAENINSIGFNINYSEEKIVQTETRINNINNEISVKEIQAGMKEAREGLQNKKTFIGALNFLNSQASISLIKKYSDRFDIIA